jgi:hypothetical protein
MISGALTFALLLAFVAGCATTETKTSSDPAAAPARSGFLSDYERLNPVEGMKGAESWRSPDADWKKYNKVMIERIQVFLKEEGKPKPIDPTDLKMLIDYFHDALVKELKPAVEIVDQEGPDVLRVRIAIVDLVPTVAYRSLLGTATPYGFVAEYASGPATGRAAGSTPYLGQTGIEAQFIDGGSKTVIAEFSDLRLGKKYGADLAKSATDAAAKYAAGYFNSFSAWGYAKEAFEMWASFFRERFDELRGINNKK